jgi:hypothetical protein
MAHRGSLAQYAGRRRADRRVEAGGCVATLPQCWPLQYEETCPRHMNAQGALRKRFAATLGGCSAVGDHHIAPLGRNRWPIEGLLRSMRDVVSRSTSGGRRMRRCIAWAHRVASVASESSHDMPQCRQPQSGEKQQSVRAAWASTSGADHGRGEEGRNANESGRDRGRREMPSRPARRPKDAELIWPNGRRPL